MQEVDHHKSMPPEILAAAKRELVAAKQALEPFEPAIDQARQLVDAAQKEMWSARRRLDHAGRVKRPAARREVKQADEALKLANDRLAETRTVAAPVQQDVDASRAAIDGGESSISTLRTLNRWSGNEARRNHLVELDGAVSTWHEWAVGASISDSTLKSSVKIMRVDSDPELQQLLAHLADAVAEWTVRAHPSILRQVQVELPAGGRGFGLDL